MTSLNKVSLIGRIGKDPVPHIFTDGSKIIGFSVATSDKWKDKVTQEWKEKTEWHNISVENPPLVEMVINSFNKGDLIYLEGQLRTRTYPKNGIDIQKTEIILKPFSGTLKLITRASDTPAKQYIEPVDHTKKKFAKSVKIEDTLDDDVLF